MAFHIVDRPQNLGALLGQGLGGGISKGLEKLTEHRVNQLNHRNVAQRFEEAGLPKEIANIMPGFSPKEQLQTLQSYAQGQQPQQQPQQQMQQPQMQNQQQLQQPQMSQQQPQQQVKPISQVATPKQQKIVDKYMQNKNLTPNQKTKLDDYFKKQGIDQALVDRAKQFTPKKNESLNRAFGETPKQRFEREKLDRKEKFELNKLDRKEQFAIDKETKPVYDKISNEAKAAKMNNVRLDRMEKLIDSGKLNDPAYAALIKTISHGIFGFGIDLTSLLTPESQEFNKLSKDFVKGAKAYFGSRLTDTDLRTFLETVPDLSQSDAGKRAVINNLKLFNEADLSRKKVAEQIIKDNNGRRPSDFDSQVEEGVAPQLDALAEQIKNGSTQTQEKSGGLRSVLPGLYDFGLLK